MTFCTLCTEYEILTFYMEYQILTLDLHGKCSLIFTLRTEYDMFTLRTEYDMFTLRMEYTRKIFTLWSINADTSLEVSFLLTNLSNAAAYFCNISLSTLNEVFYWTKCQLYFDRVRRVSFQLNNYKNLSVQFPTELPYKMVTSLRLW